MWEIRVTPAGDFDNHALDYEHIKVEPLSGAMGAEVVGVRLPEMSDAAFEEPRTVDLHARRKLSADWDALVSLENVFDADYREAQTFFPSRLAEETMPVGDIHFTPGNPRAIRVGFEYRF